MMDFPTDSGDDWAIILICLLILGWLAFLIIGGGVMAVDAIIHTPPPR